MIPTYILPYLGSNSSLIGAIVTAAGVMNPFFWLHLFSLIVLACLAFARGTLIHRQWLVAFPVLAAAFDLLPGLNFIPLVPTALHCTVLILGVALQTAKSAFPVPTVEVNTSSTAEPLTQQILQSAPTISQLPIPELSEQIVSQAEDMPAGPQIPVTDAKLADDVATTSSPQQINIFESVNLTRPTQNMRLSDSSPIARDNGSVGKHSLKFIPIVMSGLASAVIVGLVAISFILTKQNETVSLQSRIIEQTRSLVELQSNLTQKEANVKNIEDQVSQKQKQIEALEGQNSDLGKKLDEFSSELASLSAANSGGADNSALVQLQKENTSLRAEVLSHGQKVLELSLLKKQNDELQAQLANTQTELDALKQTHQQTTQQLELLQAANSNTSTKIAAATTPTPVAQASAQKTFTYHVNADIIGNDIQSIKDTTVQNCADMCMADQNCKAAVYDHWNRACFLKSSAESFRLDARAMAILASTTTAPSFVSTLPKMIKYHKRAFAAGDFKTVKFDRADQCEAQCQTENSCIAFSYLTASSSCKLYNQAEVYISDNETESGVKTQ